MGWARAHGQGRRAEGMGVQWLLRLGGSDLNLARKGLECHVKSFYTVIWATFSKNLLKAEALSLRMCTCTFIST